MYYAENEEFGIYANGKSRDATVSDFYGQFAHFCEHYRNLTNTQVTGEAAKRKRLYDSYRKIPTPMVHRTKLLLR